jgi:hypothetical protein
LKARGAWLVLMVACINFHYCLGAPSHKYVHVQGPCTLAQRSALIRLGVAADAFVDRAPGDVLFHDWSDELRNASVSAWSVYIDNLDLWELFPAAEAKLVAGTQAPLMIQADACYEVWNSPDSPDDMVAVHLYGCRKVWANDH